MSDTDLNNRVALVTGASLGIGRATAIALGQAGAKVVVNYRSHAEAAEEVVQAIEEAGSQAIAVQADVADQPAVEQMVARAVEQFGRLDIAVGNAAYSDRAPFYEIDMEGMRRSIDGTMWGAFYLLRAATQQMISQGEGGAIVLVSSPHAFMPIPTSMAYNMSKAAMEHMSRTAAIEVVQYGIRVNTIQPGWIDTPGERKFVDDEAMAKAAQSLPMKRLGRPEEIAEAIMFLCDPRHEYMTGSTLLYDGAVSLPWWATGGSAAPE